jgi:hypothetical protein
VSWLPSDAAVGLHRWARKWLAEQWPEWVPRTRTSAVEALARLVVLAADAPIDDGSAFRRQLHRWLVPDSVLDGSSPLERWMDHRVVALDELSRAGTNEIERRLGVGVDGQLLGAATAARYRKVAHACILAAVDRGLLVADPWPRISKGRARRTAARIRKAVDVRRLPDAATMERARAAITSHQPGSKKYRAMTAVVYYGGLRPSETSWPFGLHDG